MPKFRHEQSEAVSQCCGDYQILIVLNVLMLLCGAAGEKPSQDARMGFLETESLALKVHSFELMH